jgi:hypothetical protein
MENLVKPNRMITVQLQNSIRDSLIGRIVLEYNQDLVVDEVQDTLLLQSLYHEELEKKYIDPFFKTKSS